MKAKVLLVDDDDMLRDCLREGLELDGYEVTAVKNGKEAEKFLRDASFDVIATDIVMPDYDGIELIIHARKNHPDTKIVAFSALGNSVYLKSASGLGASQILIKPFTPTALSGTIQKLMSGLPAAS